MDFRTSIWCRELGHILHRFILLASLGLDGRDPALFILQQQLERLHKRRGA